MKNRFHRLMHSELGPLIIGCAIAVVFCTSLTFILLSVFPSLIPSATALMMMRTVGILSLAYMLLFAVTLLLVNRFFVTEDAVTGEGAAAPCTKKEGNDHV